MLLAQCSWTSHTLKYNPELIAFLGDEEFDLSRISHARYCQVFGRKGIWQDWFGSLVGFSLTGCLGDQSAALVGQKGFDAGSAKKHVSRAYMECVTEQ